jgi:hypothetical protein
VQPHDVSLGFVQYDADEIEVDYPVQPLGQVVEKLGQVAVQYDRFRHVQEPSVLLHQRIVALYLGLSSHRADKDCCLPSFNSSLIDESGRRNIAAARLDYSARNIARNAIFRAGVSSAVWTVFFASSYNRFCWR